MDEKHTGFVLKHTALSDSRYILDIFTLEGGTRQGVVRLNKKDSRAFFTPLTRIGCSLAGKEQQHLKRLSEINVLAHNFDLAAGYTGLALVAHWSFLVKETQPAEQPDPRVFRLLEHLLVGLRGAPPDDHNLHLRNLYFEIWLLHFLGVLDRKLPPTDVPIDELSSEERLHARLNRELLALVFQRKIEDYLPLALKLGSLNRSASVLAALWERLLDRELKSRQLFYKQRKQRGNS